MIYNSLHANSESQHDYYCVNKDIASKDFVYTHLHVMTLTFFTAAVFLARQ